MLSFVVGIAQASREHLDEIMRTPLLSATACAWLDGQLPCGGLTRPHDETLTFP